jgi:hypothetical protein
VADIDQFVAELLEAGWEYTSASVYAMPEDGATKPDHQMIIGADKTTGLGAVRYSGGEAIPGDDATEWFSQGNQVNPDGVEFAYFGTGHDWPDDSEVPLDVVKHAMAELLVSGGKRPGCVTWQVWR